MLEEEAKKLSALGPKYLKQEAIEERNGTVPFPKFLKQPEELVSGYPMTVKYFRHPNLKMQELSH
jgi:hypothetical protein